MKNGSTGKHKMLGALFGVLSIWFISGVASADTLITGVTIESVSSEFTGGGWDLVAVHVVDGSGLSGSPQTHAQMVSTDSHNSWQTNGSWGTGEIVFDLGAEYALTSMHVWNLNFYAPYNNRGAKTVDILSSTDLLGWSNKGNFVFDIATGQDGDPGFDVVFGNAWDPARYVKFSILGSYRRLDGQDDNAGLVGLSEVQFFADAAVPEPATCLLLGLGLMGLVGVRRKFKN